MSAATNPSRGLIENRERGDSLALPRILIMTG